MSRLIATFVLITAASAAHAAAPAKVLLLPFDSVGPADKAWVAKAIQQNLVAELGRVNSVQAVTADQPAKDLDAALTVAEGAGAAFVVFGAFQAVDADLRITGQVVDVAKKQTVAGLKATGPQRDLFGMEDTIAAQVRKALPAAVEVAGPEMLRQPAPPPAPAADAPIPGLDQRQPLAIDQRAKALEDEIDRAIQRLRNAPAFGGPDYYAPQNYFYSGVYAPYYYGGYPIYYTYGNGCYPCYNKGGGTSFSGNFRGNNFSGGFAVGGGSSFVTGARAPTANYASFGRMSVQPTRR